MREIKFRVWDNENKRMWNVAEVDTNGNKWIFNSGEIVGQIRAHNFEVTRLYSNFILMQFTGLRDKFSSKKGKEIYEGDIVKHQNGYLYIVEFSEINGWWCLVQPRNKKGNPIEGVYTGGINGQAIWRCKVIGNIYENPELLEEKKK